MRVSTDYTTNMITLSLLVLKWEWRLLKVLVQALCALVMFLAREVIVPLARTAADLTVTGGRWCSRQIQRRSERGAIPAPFRN